MLGHTPRKPQYIQEDLIVTTIYLDHKGIKTESNYKKKEIGKINTGKLKSMLLNNKWVNKYLCIYKLYLFIYK